MYDTKLLRVSELVGVVLVGRVTEREGEARQRLGWPEPEDLGGSQKPPAGGCCWDQQGCRQERWDDVPTPKEGNTRGCLC